MKSIIFTFISVLCAFSHNLSAQQQDRMRVGHRNALQEPVLDITTHHMEPAIVQEMTLRGFINIRVESIDISDNAHNPEYYASIGVVVTYEEPGRPEKNKISLLFPIQYDPAFNTYYGGKVDWLDVRDGGPSGGKNPDNNFCFADKCVGCATLRDSNGKTIGCGPCIPINPDLEWSCGVKNSSGLGAQRILEALSGIFIGIIAVLK